MLGLRNPQSDSRRSSRIFLNLIILGIIGVILNTVILIDEKRIRTAQAVNRVEEIYRVILASQGISPETKEGMDFSMPEDPESLTRNHPEAGRWLEEGDKFYRYSISGLKYDKGNVYPLVSAEAINAEDVFGEVIISNPDGGATVARVSELGTKFSMLGFTSSHPFLTGLLFFLLLVFIVMNASAWRRS